MGLTVSAKESGIINLPGVTGGGVPRRHYYTVSEYLAGEDAGDFRSEYVDGEIFDIAGASVAHTVLIANLIYLLYKAAKGNGFTLLPTEIKIRIESPSRFYYPDLIAAKTPVARYGKRRDTITEPTLIAEVLSDSTKRTDRGEKWQAYKAIPSLRVYLLIAQDTMRVEQWSRGENGDWQSEPTVSVGEDAVVALPILGTSVALADLYDTVPFDDDAPDV